MLNSEQTENSDDFFMGMIFWLLVGIGHMFFISYVARELAYTEIDIANEIAEQEFIEKYGSPTE